MDSKLMFLGLGAVGQSLLRLLLKEKLFSIDDILAVDCDENAFKYFEECGGKAENRIVLQVNSKNYTEVFNYLGKGDFLLCLSDGNDSLTLAEECLKRGIHFVSASDDTFDDMNDDEAFRYRRHFAGYKALAERSANLATGVLQFGINPGLVSIFTKKALTDISVNESNGYIKDNREYLSELARNGEFAKLAQELKVTAFIESDLDTTETDIKEESDTVYSTWNVPDFDGEMNDLSIIKTGTLLSLSEELNRLGVSPDKLYYYNKGDGTLVLNLTGKEIRHKSFSNELPFEGCLDAHEEVFSIHDYYTVRNEAGEIEYAPSVMFVYRPCELAMRSVLHKENTAYQLITKDRMLSGGEAVGICVEGERFKPYYVGTALYFDKSVAETPSVLLVSVSLLAAIRYILRHPSEGLLFPEYLDMDEILSYVSAYMPLISGHLPKAP